MITVSFLAGWALRSAILIVSGVVLLKMLRVKDASVRLAAWTAILCGSLAIPLLTVSLPAMPVPTRAAVIPQAPVYNRAPLPSATAVYRVGAPIAPTLKSFDWGRVAVGAYLFVAALLLVRLCLGMAMSWRWVHRSRQTELAVVRESDRVSSPMTLGIVRPVILLPTDWRAWDAAKLDAVLAHERSHIRRHDPLVQALSAVHRALLWYSPLSWYLDRRIVRLAEEASDDAAVAAVHDRVFYAETLLGFMQRGVKRTSWQGVPMARYAQPEKRIDHILNATVLSQGVTRWSIAAIVALGLPLAYVIAAAQERLTFEAASVKPATLPPGVNISRGRMTMSRGNREDFQRLRSTGGPGAADPGRIQYPLVSLTGLLHRAYDPAYFEIVAPDCG
jgi:beta-lactamase regulating signal transducer with metallopeptidase domain